MEMKEWSKITVQRVCTYNKCTLHVHHSHDTTTDMIFLMLNKSLGGSFAIGICLKVVLSLERMFLHCFEVFLHSLFCVVTLLSRGYPTGDLPVLRVKISYNYCPEGISLASNLFVLRVKIPHNYCREGISLTVYLSRRSEYKIVYGKGHTMLDYCLDSI